ncbi:M4 family metallopeptidase [Dyadobacter fermentans]|uniref:M4 family metallopeptidase n=1 Tax=Dyadobacter fermentans TaxID=94254 RepID=UPI001CBED60A|nr:M4 family metallopeptidase [Dyadobacter fermentans]MBZ1361185.1 M4 family metallopeptidase [Dyadobacter fermentans]
MKNLQCILLWTFSLLVHYTASSQNLHNPKNVDRSAMSFFDGQQTFRALEYTVLPDQQSEKIYRLQTLPENGFPEITLQGISQGNSAYFEDKQPYDSQFTDNPTPYLSSEAVQILSGFQRVMKTFDQRFNWKGSDGNGSVAIDIRMENQFETGSQIRSYYSGNANGGFFGFERNLNDNKPFQITIDVLAHEMTHSIIRYKTGIYDKSNIQCSEYIAINEGICNVFGIYIKNKINNATPQNYDWILAPQVLSLNFDIGHPKTRQYADTYNGQYYPPICVGSSPYEAGGVVTRWFYLLSSGLTGSATNDLGYTYTDLAGIGVEKVIQIIWKSLPSMKGYSDYPAFKTFTLDAAKQLYGLNSPEYQAVEKAWCAVGVCDNNLPFFSIYPANASSNIEPWPAVKVNFSWDYDNRVKEIEVQMDSTYNFTNPQVYKVSTFDTFFKSGGGVFYKGSASGYFRPHTTVYVRAKITQADPNFCKGLNPLCKIYQQFTPTHCFKTSDKRVEFWPSSTSASVNPWYTELAWKSEKDAELYLIELANDAFFNSIIYQGFAPHTGNFTETGLINAMLDTGKTYYARVAAKRKDTPKLQSNYGVLSEPLIVNTSTPSTAIIQAKTQKPNDPPLSVGSLGRVVSWDPVPGASSFVVEIAKDNAFSNIISSVTVSGNHTSTILLFPPLPNMTDLFVRALPKKNLAFGKCSNVWRIKIDESAALPVMLSPANGTTFPFKNFAAAGFEWKSGTLNMNTVEHFELHITQKTSGLTSIFTSQGKTMQLFIQDPLIFNDHQGLQASVLAVNSLGAKTALSQPFDYTICDDHPAVFFPGDLGKVDPTKNFNVQWFPSESFPPGSQFLVTIKEAGLNPLPGFTDKPTTANFMLVPAGTLTNGKNYTVTVKNSSSCAALLLPVTFFSAVGSGGSNQPPQPKLVDFNIDLKGFRNDPDAFSVPPAYGTSNYELGVELFDPNGNVLALLDPNGMQVTKLLVDSENSGVIMVGNNKPQGKYKLRLKLAKIFPPNTYYPLDQPRFSVLLNNQVVVSNHVITFDLFNPGSSFDEWKEGFQFADIMLDIK